MTLASALKLGVAPVQVMPVAGTLMLLARLAGKMAMKLGSKYRFSEVMARHWGQFASEAGLSPAQVRRRVLESSAVH